jgi:hypothetical protein
LGGSGITGKDGKKGKRGKGKGKRGKGKGKRGKGKEKRSGRGGIGCFLFAVLIFPSFLRSPLSFSLPSSVLRCRFLP